MILMEGELNSKKIKDLKYVQCFVAEPAITVITYCNVVSYRTVFKYSNNEVWKARIALLIASQS